MNAKPTLEQQLADVQFKLDAIVGCSPSALSLKSPDGRYVLANPNFQKILHLTEHQIIGQLDTELFPEEFASAYQGNDQTILNTKSRQSIEELIPVDGEIRRYLSHMFPVTDETGQIRYICRISLDMTDKFRAEAQVNKLVQAIEQSPVSVVITDDQQIVEFVNQAFVQTSGYSSHEIIGQSCRVLQSDKTPPETLRNLQQHLQAGQVWRGEFISQTKEGREYIESAIIAPVRDLVGRITHYTSAQQDITEARLKERELDQHRAHLEELVKTRTLEADQAKNEAESANKAKSAFLSTVSHEIRNLLGGIQGITDLLGMHPLNSELKDLVDLQHNAIDQMAGLLNNVLDFSKIEAGKMELDLHPFDLADLIENIAKLKQIRCAQKGLSFSLVKSFESKALCMGDAIRLRQVIQNLLSNAYKFTVHGGIVLEVRSSLIEQSFAAVTIKVSDTGVGIKETDLQKLFQPFVQVGVDENIKAKGTGLGLSIVQRLVELMGGTVTVQSEYGKGSTFAVSLRLPLAQEPALPKPDLQNNSRAQLPVAGLNILLVDDDHLSRRIVRALLQKLGHSVCDVPNGHTALTQLNEEPFDLVLTDYSMPDMTGIDLVKRSRGALACAQASGVLNKQPKFFCLTGHTEQELLNQLLHEGFDASFTKPLNLQAFGTKLSEFWGTRKA